MDPSSSSFDNAVLSLAESARWDSSRKAMAAMLYFCSSLMPWRRCERESGRVGGVRLFHPNQQRQQNKNPYGKDELVLGAAVLESAKNDQKVFAFLLLLRDGSRDAGVEVPALRGRLRHLDTQIPQRIFHTLHQPVSTQIQPAAGIRMQAAACTRLCSPGSGKKKKTDKIWGRNKKKHSPANCREHFVRHSSVSGDFFV
jgi:hypothetical protein